MLFKLIVHSYLLLISDLAISRTVWVDFCGPCIKTVSSPGIDRDTCTWLRSSSAVILVFLTQQLSALDLCVCLAGAARRAPASLLCSQNLVVHLFLYFFPSQPYFKNICWYPLFCSAVPLPWPFWRPWSFSASWFSNVPSVHCSAQGHSKPFMNVLTEQCFSWS